MFGAPDPEEATRRVMSGQSWAEFCDLLKMAGSVLERAPEDPQTRAEGMRYLSRLTRAALQTFVEHADPKAPVLQRVVHETAKIGNDNPDNIYFNAAVSGAYTYRLSGTRGSVHWMEFATQKGQYGEGRGMPPTGRLDAKDLTLDEDGRFEVMLSVERPGDGVDWLPMEPETGTLIVRQSRLDPATEVLPELTLARIGGDGRPTPITAPAIDEGLRRSAMLVAGASRIFSDWVDGFLTHVNALPRFDQALSNQMGGVADIVYHHSYWRLADDEALVIESDPFPCDHWNFQLSNHFMESLDYRYDRIHTNSKIASVQADGRIRLVVAHEDPGQPNWLYTQNHRFGAMGFRWVRPEGDPPTPTCRVVKLAELRA